MIRALFLEDPMLWTCLWQSTLVAGIGLAGSFLLARRPARGFQVLLLTMIAAVLVPVMSLLVKHYDLGVLPAEPMSRSLEVRDWSATITEDTSTAWFVPEPQIPMHEPTGTVAEVAHRSADLRVPWRTIFVLGWMIATLALLGRLLAGVWNGIRLLRRSRPGDGPHVQQATNAARTRLGITEALLIRSSAEIHSPMIWCWSRPPVLLVPQASDDQVDWVGVICHELAHWSRRDHLSGLTAELIVCLLSWNPLLWWSKRRMIRLGEQACDDWVVAGGHPVEKYARALLSFKPQRHGTFVPAVVNNGSGVAGRVRRILNDACGNPRAGTKWALGATLFVACVAVGFAFAQTRPAEPVAATAGKAESTPQNADKSAANNEKSGQPRYAARTFNSQAALEVFVRETGSHPVRQVGHTPSAAPLEIPACVCWWVQSSEPVKDWDLLLREMNQARVPGLRLEQATDADLRHVADYVELEYLDLSNSSVTDAGLACLKGLTALQVLNLAATLVTDAGLTHLKDLIRLQVLNLDGTLVTDAGLARLKDLATLRDLNLSGTPITDAGLEHLKSLTGLRSLSLRKTQVTDAGLEHLKGLTGLSDLALSCTRITDAGLVCFKNMMGLRSLTLGANRLTDAGLKHLQSLTELRALHFTLNPITDAGLEYLKGLTKLEWLNLGGNLLITDSGLQQLQQSLPKLTIVRERTEKTVQSMLKAGPLPYEPVMESAELAGCFYVARSFNSRVAFEVSVISGTARKIGQTPSVTPLKIPDCGYWFVQPVAPVKDWDLVLKELNANRVPGLKLAPDTADSDLQHLAGLTGLEYLSLADTQVTGTGLVHLRGLTRLLSLDLQGTKITGPGLEHLKRLPRLERLDLSRTPITDAGLDYLRDLKALERLILVDTRITDAGLEHVRGVSTLGDLNLRNTRCTGAALADLQAGPRVWNLDMYGAPVTDADLPYFKNLKILGRLVLSNTKITGAGLESLQVLSRLGNLQISNIKVTDADLVYLEGLTELHQLDLRGTEITGPGLQHFKALTKMRNLNLAGTKVGDSGLTHLANLPGLERLFLGGTSVTDEGLAHLRGLTALNLLELSGTKVTDGGLVHVKGMTGLQTLGLNVMAITDAGLVHLKDLTGLQQLGLTGARITDAGLANLTGLTGLQTLNLYRTQVTDAGARQLKQSLPKLNIVGQAGRPL